MTLYITKKGQRMGPYSLAEAQRLVANGTFLATEWAWHEGLPNWIPLNRVSGFAPTSPAASSALPPVPIPAAPPPTPMTPLQRPPLVWIISIFYILNTLFVLMNVAALSLSTSDASPFRQMQEHHFAFGTVFSFTLLLVNVALNLGGAIFLLLLRRQALYFFIISLGINALAMTGQFGLFITYHISIWSWLSIAFAWAVKIASILCIWRLCQKGVLR